MKPLVILIILYNLFLLPVLSYTDIKLNPAHFHIHPGFKQEWLTTLPTIKNNAINTQSAYNHTTTYKLTFKEMETMSKNDSRRIFSKYPLMIYTLLYPFDRPADLSNCPALYIPDIGNNYEIYLNGILLKSENYINDNHIITKDRYTYSLLLELPKKHIKPKGNILGFKLAGHSKYDGFNNESPIIIGDYITLYKTSENRVVYAIYFTILIIGFYSLLFYIFQRKELHHLFLALFCIFFSLTNYMEILPGYHTIGGSYKTWLLVSFFFGIYASITSLIFFLDILVFKKIPVLSRIIGGVLISIGLCTIAFNPDGIYDFTLMFFPPVVLLVGVYCIILRLFTPFIKDIREISKQFKNLSPVKRWGKTMIRVLFSSNSGILMLNSIIFMIIIIVSIVYGNYLGYKATLINYGVAIFIGGVVLLLAKKYQQVHRQLAVMNLTLEDKVKTRTIELEEAHKEILTLEKRLTEEIMAGGFAHEMRNALAGAKFTLSKAISQKKAMSSERLYEIIDYVFRSLDRGLNITGDIMTYAKIGKSKPSKTPLNPDKLVTSYINDIRGDFHEKEIRITTSLNANGTISGNVNHFISVISNIILNAGDALSSKTNNEDRKIVVTSKTDDNSYILLIEDNGPGIPQDKIQKIFEPFYSTKPKKGTGLGLAMSAKYVSIYDGIITVESEYGFYTRFMIKFPLCKTCAEKDADRPHP